MKEIMVILARYGADSQDTIALEVLVLLHAATNGTKGAGREDGTKA